MIDIFNQVFTKIYDGVGNTATVKGEYIPVSSQFPCVTVEEMDNYVYTDSSDENLENHAWLMYEINVYSNKKNGRKSECRALMATVDEIMLSNGFTRIMMSPIPNQHDATIYRIVARYRCVVSKDDHILYQN
ncbi:hypothetical protein J6V85_03300 [Candidatus Saccharibacteria bacterium]|nr:hypothetical protein [Candidatus Saccharibacteria bacterium]